MIVRAAKRLVRRAANFALRVCRRLRVFPFSLGYTVLSAGVRWRGLMGSKRLARVGEAECAASPLAVLIWLDRIADDVSGRAFDVCLRLSPGAEDDRLHDIFSILLASPRLQSLALYWDEERLLEDLPLFQARGDRAGVSVWSSVREDLGSPGAGAIREFLTAPHHGPLALPVAARREAEILLKRLVGGAWAVCLNLPDSVSWLAEEMMRAFPDARFLDLRLGGPASIGGAVALDGFGLTLHERLALAGAADAYVGRFDELGGAAVLAGRTAVLIGGGDAGPNEWLSRFESLWVGRGEGLTPMMAGKVVQFLREHRALT